MPAISSIPAGSVCVIVPSLNAEATLGGVLDNLRSTLPGLTANRIYVVDDGSRDGTAQVAFNAGVRVVSHGRNRGKGAAILTGLATAHAHGYRVALTVDADGQHLAESANALLAASNDPSAFVLGVRNLSRDGAPKANQISNAISNFFLTRFTSRRLLDTQCGLRRYPVQETLGLGLTADGYAFEAEVILRAIAAGLRLVQVPIRVSYPASRTTHFDNVRDPARIIAVVLNTRRRLRHAPSRA